MGHGTSDLSLRNFRYRRKSSVWEVPTVAYVTCRWSIHVADHRFVHRYSCNLLTLWTPMLQIIHPLQKQACLQIAFGTTSVKSWKATVHKTGPKNGVKNRTKNGPTWLTSNCRGSIFGVTFWTIFGTTFWTKTVQKLNKNRFCFKQEPIPEEQSLA